MATSAQYAECLLNTCIRLARTAHPNLSLTNWIGNPDFIEHAIFWLEVPFFSERPIEPQMEYARQGLLHELNSLR